MAVSSPNLEHNRMTLVQHFIKRLHFNSSSGVLLLDERGSMPPYTLYSFYKFTSSLVNSRPRLIQISETSNSSNTHD